MTEQQRHKPPSPLQCPRELVIACPPFRSAVNLSRIVRLAGCAGVTRLIVSGSVKIDPKIARDGIEQVKIERRNSLPPVLKKMRKEGYRIVGLEQTDNSKSLFDFEFPRRTLLLIGHERLGISEEQLGLVDQCVEIPVYGMPFSYNVATATTMAVYEYCRQFPNG